MLSRPIFKER